MNSYFIKKMHSATFDGLSSWLIDDDAKEVPVVSYIFSRVNHNMDLEMDEGKMMVNSCASYQRAIKHGYSYFVGPTHPGPQEEIHYDLRDCKIMDLFSKARPAKISYLRDFNVDQLTEQNLITLAKGFFDEFPIKSVSAVKYYPATYFVSMKLNEGTKDYVSANLKILGWADFTRSGLDSVLVEVFARSHNAHGRVTLNKVFILTRKRPNAPLKIAKQVDEIAY